MTASSLKRFDIQGEPVAAWVPCSPEWIAAGGDCANAPRIWSEELKNHLHPTAPAPDAAVEALVKHMVDRFLAWKLPDDFNPDGGISFKREFNENTPWPMKHEPIGTNLFTATQAEAMVRYLLAAFGENP